MLHLKSSYDCVITSYNLEVLQEKCNSTLFFNFAGKQTPNTKLRKQIKMKIFKKNFHWNKLSRRQIGFTTSVFRIRPNNFLEAVRMFGV